jgi:mannose-6-phosphate isomerase-like protein (cupin superfamily)
VEDGPRDAVDGAPGGVEGGHQQRLQEPGAGVVLAVGPEDLRFQRQRRGLVVGEVAFEHQPLGHGAGLEVVAGELEGGQRVQRERHREHQGARRPGWRHVGEAAAHPAILSSRLSRCRTPGSGKLPAVGNAELPRHVEKPWGSELWFAHTERYAGKLLRVKAGTRLSVQYHVSKDETSYLLSGRIVLSRGDSADSLVRVEVEPGGVWRNQPGEVHSVEALEDSEIIEVSTPEVDDVVRLADDYGRG